METGACGSSQPGAEHIARAIRALRGTLPTVDDSTQRGTSRETLIADPLSEVFRMLEAVENFARGASQADDLTLLIVRYRAAGARATTDTDAAPAAQSVSA